VYFFPTIDTPLLRKRWDWGGITRVPMGLKQDEIGFRHDEDFPHQLQSGITMALSLYKIGLGASNLLESFESKSIYQDAVYGLDLM
jgi:hypothetical protein